MLKKIGYSLIELVILCSSGIMLAIALSGGFSLTAGHFKFGAHNLLTPLMLFFIALSVRRVLVGSFFHGFLSLRWIRLRGMQLCGCAERLFDRLIASPAFRNRAILGGVFLSVLTIVTVLIHPVQTGLTAKYYNNSIWAGTPFLSIIDQQLDLSRMTRNFSDIQEHYSIEWTGMIVIPVTGEYQFTTISDDGSELSIRDRLIVDNRGMHGVQEQTGVISLEKGIHPLTLKYMQGSGGANLEIYWQPPTQKRTLLSHALLLQAAPTSIVYVWLYQMQQFLLPLWLLLWCGVGGILGTGIIIHLVKTWKLDQRISPLTVKLFVFVFLNGLIVNVVLFWFSDRIFEGKPVVRDINVGLYATRFFLSSPTHNRLDSWAYLYAAREYLSHPGKKTVYEELYFTRQMKFQYPPTSVLLVEPFRWLSQQEFIAVANCLSWIGILGTMLILPRLFSLGWQHFPSPGVERMPDKLTQIVLAACFTVTFYPLMWSFRLGQIQTWIYVLFILAIWAWMSGYKSLAGISIGIICIIKPQLGLLGLWGLLRKQGRFTAGLIGTVGILGMISLACYGLANHVEYLTFLSYMSKYGESYYANQSVNGLLHRVLFNGPNVYPDIGGYPPYNRFVHLVTLLSSVALIAAALLWRRRGGQQSLSGEMSDFSIAALTFTVASPIAWIHHYNVLLPMFVVALPATLHFRREKPAVFLLSLAFVLCGNFFYTTNYLAHTRWNVLQSLFFFGALLFLGVLYWVRDNCRAGV